MQAEVRTVNGLPELFIEGRMHSRMWGRVAIPSELAPEKLEQYAGAGIDVFMTGPHGSYSLGWDGADGYDYASIEAHLARLVRAKPDIRLVLFCGCPNGVPYRWAKAHHDQLALMDNGLRLNMASLGSTRWLADVEEAFRRYVEHFEASPFAENVIGYNPVLTSNEWFGFSFGKTEPQHGWDDYSEVARTAFRSWLRTQYEGDRERLREAWRDRRVDFDRADVPPVAMRLDPGDGRIFNQAEGVGRRLADYNRFYNEANAGRAIVCCRGCKAAAPKKLAGVMHGYSWGGPHMMAYTQDFGHAAAPLILSSEHIDFVHSPYSYFNRLINDSSVGVHVSQHAPDSVRAYGKLFVDQWDSRTHLAVQAGARCGGAYRSYSVRQSLDTFERDLAASVCRASPYYLQEAGPGHFASTHGTFIWGPFHYDDEVFAARMPHLRRITDRAQAEGGRPRGEIAVVTSNESVYFQRPERAFNNLFLAVLRHWALPACGVPFHDYMLEDFERIAEPHRLYIFPNALYVPRARRAFIRRRLEAEGATAVWCYGAGYFDEEGEGLAGCAALTGITLECSDDRDFLQVTIDDHGHPATSEPDCPEAYGSDVDAAFYDCGCEWWGFPADREAFRFAPLFYAADEEARSLGTLPGGQPGLVVKENGPVTDVFSAAPLVSPALLRGLASAAGAHVYSRQNDIVYASERYLGITAGDQGERTVHLPGTFAVTDAWSDESLSPSTDTLCFTARRGETRLFRLAPTSGP